MLLTVAAWVWLTVAPAKLTLELPVRDQARRELLLLHLELEEHDTAVWYWTWGLGWVLATGVQFATWPWTPVEDRPSLVAWGITSAVSAAVTLGLRPAALGSTKRAREGDAEATFLEVRDDEIFAHSVWQQVGCLLLNAVPYLVLGFGYHRWEKEWPFLVAGLVMGEAQIFTAPQLLRRFGVRALPCAPRAPGA